MRVCAEPCGFARLGGRRLSSRFSSACDLGATSSSAELWERGNGGGNQLRVTIATRPFSPSRSPCRESAPDENAARCAATS